MDDKHNTADACNDKDTQNHKHYDKTACIVDIEDAPAYLIDNKYLLKGYRKNFFKYNDILRSLFMAHNETLNFWTHFLGSVVLIWVLYYLLNVSLPHDSVIIHLKELRIKRPSFEQRLHTIKSDLTDCHIQSKASDLLSHSSVYSDNHVCTYIRSIIDRKFDSSFIDMHNNIVRGHEKSRLDETLPGIISTIMHTVDKRITSFTLMSWMSRWRCGQSCSIYFAR